jgi:DNA-directed RNA polymerase specialized sigma24 family protein
VLDIGRGNRLPTDWSEDLSDEAWFVDLYERRYAAVFAYGLRRIGADLARDMTAEVFLVAWRRRRPLPAAAEELPWLYATARRITANLLRTEGRRIALVRRASSVLASAVQTQLDPLEPVDPPPSAPALHIVIRDWNLNTRVSSKGATSSIEPTTVNHYINSGDIVSGKDGGVRSPRTWPANLSSDPTILRRQLEVGHPAGNGVREVFQAVKDLYSEAAPQPAVRGAVLQVLAAQSGSARRERSSTVLAERDWDSPW